MTENPTSTIEVDELKDKFIEERKKHYLESGLSEEESIKASELDYEKAKEHTEHHADEAWNDVTKKIGLVDFIDDQIRRALGIYKTEWEKKNNPQTINFKLHLRKHKTDKSSFIAGASLILEYAVNGNWKMINEKKVNFTHISQIRQENLWKLSLYESMLQSIVSTAMSFKILSDQYAEQPRNQA